MHLAAVLARIMHPSMPPAVRTSRRFQGFGFYRVGFSVCGESWSLSQRSTAVQMFRHWADGNQPQAGKAGAFTVRTCPSPPLQGQNPSG